MRRREFEVSIWDRFLFTGVGKEKYLELRPRVLAKNRSMLISYGLLAAVMMAMLLILSALPGFNTTLSRYTPYFAVFAVVFGLCCCIARYAITDTSNLIIPLFYLMMIAMFVLAILLGSAQALSTTFLVMLFAVPLLIVDVPVRVTILLVAASVAFCISSAVNNSTSVVHNGNIMNCMIFLFSGIYINYINQKSRFDEMLLTQKVERERDTDALTRVSTKESALARMSKKLIDDKKIPAVMIMMDLDHFESINNNYGHTYGDAVLRSVGQKLNSLYRADDIISRFDGDQFCLFLSGVSTRESATICVEKLRKEFKEDFPLRGTEGSITCCFGVAFYPGNAGRFDDLLEKAGDALSKAKKKGADQYVFAD